LRRRCRRGNTARMRGGTWAAGVGLVPLLLVPLSLASPLAAQTHEQVIVSLPRIDWQAPLDCPDADAVSARLRETLDGELLAFAHDWQIRGLIAADGASSWRLVLELREPGTAASTNARQRVLRAARCDDLADAAAVAIAIALGDAISLGKASALDSAEQPENSSAHAHDGADTAASAAAPEAAHDDSAPRNTEPAPALERARPRLDLALGALLDSATLGAWSVGGTLSARGWFDRLGLGLHGVWLPPSTIEIAPGQGADLSLLGAGVRACYAPLVEASLRFATCAGFELGRFGANGRGLVEAERLHDVWIAPGLSADVQGHVLGDLGLSSRVELLLPLERREYRVDLDQPVHDTPRLTFRWVVGVSTDFAL